MYDIITAGEILVEILAESEGQVFYKPGRLLGPYPSGAPAIAIDQAARMGAKTAIIAKVGKDDFGRINIERLSQDGVDVSRIIETDKNTTGVAFVTYLGDGSRQFIFHFSNAACGELCVDDIDEDVIKSARYLHIMGCSVTGSPPMSGAVMHAVRIAWENGVKISFDPNIRPELLHGDVLGYYREILDCATIILTSKSELSALLGGDTTDSVRRLLKQKERIVVVKDGSRQTAVYTRTEAFTVDCMPAAETDPTGAGDCFDGTFLAMLCEGADLKKAAVYANAAGAKAVEKRGPMEGNSSREEIEAVIKASPPPVIREIKNPYTS